MTRESDLYKDKIEVSLDGRQIFYLFFGGAVIVGLVFVLGVMVGRRVEARAHVDPAKTQSAADPLAALDRLEARGMTFQSTLTGSAAPTEVEHAIADLEKARKAAAKKDAKKDAKAEKVEAKVEAKVDAKPAAKVDGKLEAKSDARVDAKSETKLDARTPAKPDARVDAKSEAKAEPKLEAKIDPKGAAKLDGKIESKPVPKFDGKLDAKAPAKPDAKPDAKVEARPDAVAAADKADAKSDKKTDKPKKHDDDKGKFTLQLSSFQDKAEADAFVATIKAAGYQPYLTEAAVDGKGTFYRVRLGSYRSLEAASNAKSEVDAHLKKPAQVTKL